ncbi:MAG: SPFH domain-containing protein [Eubacterium sp.]|nr:SPFH domain-containing protein [Candidatus Colimonas fimequi]
MGLIKAAVGAATGVLADQWKDYFYCEALDADTLVVKGQKKASGRSSNKHGEDNVITNGAGIAVADGQCMIIVEQGEIVELCAEPGVFTYNNEISPSIFVGDLKEGLKGAAKDAFERFTFGGGVGKDQRIYYFNTKEIIGNKYGTANPIPFSIIDRQLNFQLDTQLKCNGEYSYKIINPMLFYKNVCGNVSDDYTRENIDSMMKSELLTALAPAFGQLAANGVRYSELSLHTVEIADALNDVMSKKWAELRGVQVVSFGINSVSIPEGDLKRLQDLQSAVPLQNQGMAAATMTAATADAMRSAAANENGAMGAFMGMGMAQNAGGNLAGMYAAAQGSAPLGGIAPAPEAPAAPAAPAADPNAWTCACGAVNTGKFCSECGAKKPEAAGWTCACGAVNTGKFCSECGAKKPE